MSAPPSPPNENPPLDNSPARLQNQHENETNMYPPHPSLDGIKVYTDAELFDMEQRVKGLDDIVNNTKETLNQCEIFISSNDFYGLGAHQDIPYRQTNKENVSWYGGGNARFEQNYQSKTERSRGDLATNVVKKKKRKNKKKRRGNFDKNKKGKKIRDNSELDITSSSDDSESDSDLSGLSTNADSSSDAILRKEKSILKRHINTRALDSRLKKHLHKVETSSSKGLRRVQKQLEQLELGKIEAGAGTVRGETIGASVLSSTLEHQLALEKMKNIELKARLESSFVSTVGRSEYPAKGFSLSNLVVCDQEDKLKDRDVLFDDDRVRSNAEGVRTASELAELKINLSNQQTRVLELENDLKKSNVEKEQMKTALEESNKKIREGRTGGMDGNDEKLGDIEEGGSSSNSKLIQDYEIQVKELHSKIAHKEKEYENSIRLVESQWENRCRAIQEEYTDLQRKVKGDRQNADKMEKSVEGLQRKANEYKVRSETVETELYEERQRSKQVEERYQSQCKEFLRCAHLLLHEANLGIRKINTVMIDSRGNFSEEVDLINTNCSSSLKLFSGPDVILELKNKLKIAIAELQEKRLQQLKEFRSLAKQYEQVKHQCENYKAQLIAGQGCLQEREKNIVYLERQLTITQQEATNTQKSMRVEYDALKDKWVKSLSTLKEAENALQTKQELLAKWQNENGNSAPTSSKNDKETFKHMEKLAHYESLLNKYVTYKEKVVTLRKELKETCLSAEQATDHYANIVKALKDQSSENKQQIKALAEENAYLQNQVLQFREQHSSEQTSAARQLKKDLTYLRNQLNEQKIKNSLLRKRLNNPSQEHALFNDAFKSASTNVQVSRIEPDNLHHSQHDSEGESGLSKYIQSRSEIATARAQRSGTAEEEPRPFKVVVRDNDNSSFPHSLSVQEFLQQENDNLETEMNHFQQVIGQVFHNVGDEGGGDQGKSQKRK